MRRHRNLPKDWQVKRFILPLECGESPRVAIFTKATSGQVEICANLRHNVKVSPVLSSGTTFGAQRTWDFKFALLACSWRRLHRWWIASFGVGRVPPRH